MKKITLILSAVAALSACNNAPKADEATTTDTQAVTSAEGTSFTVDSTTTVTWTGAKPTGTHAGTFKVTEGSLVVAENKLASGGFTIDVTSLNNTDLAGDAENKGKLEGHLKSPDFFDVAKYPTAKFEITSVEPFVAGADTTTKIKTEGATHIIKGNLTLKDSTKNISFPAKVTVSETAVTANADFNIDRTLWGMNYKGPNNPQDWVINKEVNLKIALSATKK
ncbi:MAG: YceI family protein [Gloeobacteraceae cyanobacterium ES-bin-316]|nr:YceI family protein [Ferruginibacter sp.]